MKHSWNAITVLAILLLSASAALAQKNELGILVGRLEPTDRGLTALAPIDAALSGSVAYQFNYSRRLLDGQIASLHWEMVIAGAPQSGVKSTSLLLPKNYSSLFFTPGLKLKLFPGGGISPYVVGGAGLSRYKENETRLDGQPNTGDRQNTTWGFNYGAGIDFSLIGPVALRGEVRDFLTGNPEFNVPFLENKQHNVFVGVGIVFRW